MINLNVTMNIDLDPWTDLIAGQLKPARLDRIGLLPAGTAGGKASVAMIAVTDTGDVVFIETTWALFNTAARALAGSPVAQMECL